MKKPKPKTSHVKPSAAAAMAIAAGTMLADRAMLMSESHQRAMLARLSALGAFDAAVQDAGELQLAGSACAVIPIVGVLNKEWDYGGFCSTARVMAQLDQCLGDAAVGSIVLDIDSPGGLVNGAVELADAVREAGAHKPVTAVVRGLCCSGAYWIASQAGKIIARPEAEVGNIGVYSVLADWSAYYAALGIELTTIASGEFKGLGADGRVTDDLVSDTRRIVTGLFQQFVGAVAAGRQLDAAAATGLSDGRAFLGVNAKSLGLIDELATTFGAAIQIATGAVAPGKEAAMGSTPTATAAPVTTEAKTQSIAAVPPGQAAKSDAADDDAKTSNEAARAALESAIKAAAAHKAAARGAKDHADEMTEADDETKSLAHRAVKAIDAAHDEASRCAKAWLSLAGEQDDPDDPKDDPKQDPDDDDAKGQGDEGTQSRVEASAYIAAFGDAGAKMFLERKPFAAAAAEFIARLRADHKTETDALKAENATLKQRLAALPRGNEEALASVPANAQTGPSARTTNGLSPGLNAFASSIRLPGHKQGAD